MTTPKRSSSRVAALAEQNRKRKHVSPPKPRISISPDAEEVDESTEQEQMDLMNAAIKLFSKKHGFSQIAVKAALEADQQETLPSINDPDAIDAFFRKNRRRSFKDLIPNYDASKFEKKSGSKLPSSHPMKPFVDQSDKEMSVKEALAKGFRNYKVRLPKTRKDLEAYTNRSSSTDLASLFNSPATYDDYSSNKQRMSSASTLNELLANAFGNLPDTSKDNSPAISDGDDVNGEAVTLEDVLRRADIGQQPSVKGSDALLYYRIPPFWQNPLDVIKGYKGGYHVKGVRYVCMATLIHKGVLAVPLDQSFMCLLGTTVCEMTLHQILILNGLIINDPYNMEDIYEVISLSSLVIHHAIAEVIVKSPKIQASLSLTPRNKEDAIIQLSRETPPITSHKPHLFRTFLGTKQGVNEIMDDYQFPVLSDEEPEPELELEPSSPFVENFTPVVQPADERQLTTKEQFLYVITNLEAGVSKDVICMRYDVSMATIDAIMANKEQIQQMATQIFMNEVKDEAGGDNHVDPRLLRDVTGKRKNKKRLQVRRTSFVGLNILMWRFFKECADKGVPLNGKLLKEHAMAIAKQLGLDSFKGSEGWLDAFKRRHKIDLKQMTGSPAKYEDDGELPTELMEDDDKETENWEQLSQFQKSFLNSIFTANNSDDLSPSRISSTNSVDGNGVTAALLNSVEKAAQPGAIASISNMKPLDLNNLFKNINPKHEPMDMTPFDSNSIENYINFGAMETEGCSTPGPKLCYVQPLDEGGFISSIVKSAAIDIPNQQLSAAMNTIRAAIVAHDPSAMGLFLALQERVAKLPASTD